MVDLAARGETAAASASGVVEAVVRVAAAAFAPPLLAEQRRRILAEAVRLHHWSVVVPALDADELGGLLGVIDRFGALYHQDDHQDDHQDNPDV